MHYYKRTEINGEARGLPPMGGGFAPDSHFSLMGRICVISWLFQNFLYTARSAIDVAFTHAGLTIRKRKENL